MMKRIITAVKKTLSYKNKCVNRSFLALKTGWKSYGRQLKGVQVEHDIEM